MGDGGKSRRKALDMQGIGVGRAGSARRRALGSKLGRVNVPNHPGATGDGVDNAKRTGRGGQDETASRGPV